MLRLLAGNTVMATEMTKRAGHAFGAVGTPLTYALAAVAAASAVPRLEARFLPELASPIGASQAIAILSAIASGMLPLTGLVFSLAFVMVQFSATAYSPRLVAWLAGSGMMSHALGVFTATFLYSLGALAWVDRGGSGQVPFVTVWLAILLLLVSVVFFVRLVEKLGTLQISRVLDYIGDQGRAVIADGFAPFLPGASEDPGPAPLPPAIQVVTHQGGPAVIQAIDVERLVALAERADATLAVAGAVGDTVANGMPLLRVHGAARPLAERSLRRTVKLGTERTFEQDPKYAVRLLVDIAIKALSPAINDPTTAVQALDQLEDLLLRLAGCSLSAGRARDARGRLRLVYPVASWDDLLGLALDEIRFYGGSSIQVMRRMHALLAMLIEHAPAERRPALERYLERVDQGIQKSFADAEDRGNALEADRQGLGVSSERRRD
jgi:uncharacterized membrane protein